ncbi:MAG: aminoglycoside phosphotransferase family protein [Sandarakinorhabdus sp.]|jgi:hypothetical protein|nr:aminoglycoside phosphotransferase family protein [Sandarakinorhabdus sp.]
MMKAGSIPTTPTDRTVRPADDHQHSAAASEDDLKPQRLVRHLLSAGIITPAECLAQGVMLRPVGRSHSVWKLNVGNEPRAAIKLFGPSRGGTDGSAVAEHAVQDLAASVPELAALLPERLVHAGPRWLVAHRWVAGEPAWQDDSLASGGGSPAADIAALAPRVAPGLAAMHRATARLVRAGDSRGLQAGLDDRLPWVLALFDADAPPELWSHGLLAPVLNAAGQRPALVAGIRRARGAWRPLALIHADLKHDNLLLKANGGVTLVDWELARCGDPAWDLAGLMFRPLLDPAPERQGWTPANQQAARSMLAAYAGASGLARPALAQRLLFYCGAWLLMSVVQYRSAATQPDEGETRRLLDAAEQSLAAPESLVASLADAP